MTQSIHNPHDRFFRRAMSDIRVAREFFMQHLPAAIQAGIDFDTLSFHKESFIDEELKTSAADVIYSTTINHQQVYLYILVEHQSTVDKWMTFRLLRYMVRILEHHRMQFPETNLPVVYPLIFYNGPTQYTGSTDLFALFGEHKNLAKDIFMRPFQLIDTQQIPDEELRKYQWAGILEFVLKHRFMRDFLVVAEPLMRWLHQVERMDGYTYAKTVLKYIFDGLEGHDAKAVVEIAKQHLSPKLEGDAMTFADQLRQEGYQQGIQEGLIQGKTFGEQLRQEGYQQGIQQGEKQLHLVAERLLAKDLSPTVVAEITGLPITVIEKLQFVVSSVD